MNTRDMIREFSVAFERPVNESLTRLTVTERELLGKLLLEETLEYCTKGLGLKITIPGWDNGDFASENDNVDCSDWLVVTLDEGQTVDPVECADGLADVNVVIHFAAHWQGINLDRATEIVNASNMSKLGPDGKPIINGVTPGYRNAESCGDETVAWRPDFLGETGFDPSKPIGKILKGPNFYEPQVELTQLIMTEGNNA